MGDFASLQPEAFAEVFAALHTAEQAQLRAASRATIQAFDVAVADPDCRVALAGSHQPPAAAFEEGCVMHQGGGCELLPVGPFFPVSEWAVGCRDLPRRQQQHQSFGIPPPQAPAHHVTTLVCSVPSLVEQRRQQCSGVHGVKPGVASRNGWLKRARCENVVIRHVGAGIGDQCCAVCPRLRTLTVARSRDPSHDEMSQWHTNDSMHIDADGCTFQGGESSSPGPAGGDVDGADDARAALPGIGDRFAADCFNLATVHVAGGTLLGLIGDDFLRGASALTSLDLSGLRGVRRLGHYCLAETRALRSLDLSPWSQVVSAGNSWLRSSGIAAFDAASLPSLVAVEDDWLAFAKIEAADFSALRRLVSVGGGWLASCRELRHVTFCELPELRMVGASWLDGAAAIERVDFGAMPELQQVGCRWMLNCAALRDIRVDGLQRLGRVGPSWLDSCPALERFDVATLPCLVEVGHSWLLNCRALVSVRIEFAPRLERVGPSWMDGCVRLEAVDVRSSARLSALGQRLLAGCERVRPEACSYPPHPDGRAAFQQAVERALRRP